MEKKNIIEPVIRKYVTWITRHPWLVIGVFLIISVFLVSRIRNLKIEMDSDRLLPKQHPTVILGDRIAEQFHGKYVVVVNVAVKDGTIYNPVTLEKVQKITEAVKNLPGIIESNVLSVAAPNVKDIRGTGEGLEVSQMMETIPQTEEELQRVRDAVNSNPTFRGLLVSADEKSTTIAMDFATLEEVGGFMGARKAIVAITDPQKDDNTNIYLAGNPINVYWLGTYAQRIKFVFPVALLVIALLLYYAFRTRQGIIIPLTAALLSVLWALGFIGWTKTPLDVFNIMTPILILAIAAGHAVQLLKRYYEEYNRLRDNKAAIIEAATRISTVMFTAGFAAAAGFMSLLVFQNLSMKAFGLFTALGILSALVIEISLIPAMQAVLAPPTDRQLEKERKRTVFDAFLDRISKMIIDRKWAGTIITALVLVCIAIFGMTRLKTENSPSSLFFQKSEFIQDLHAINRNTAGGYIVQILVEGTEDEILKDPQELRNMESVQNYASSLPDVGKAVSLVDVMKRLNKAMHADSAQYESIPETRDLVAQYLLLYSLSSSPSDFDRMVSPDYKQAVITLYTKYDSYEYARNIESKIEAFAKENLPGTRLTFQAGGGIMYGAALTDIVVHGKIKNMVQICVIIFLIICLVFFSITGGLMALLPLIISVIVNMGLMGLCGIWLSTATATISAMAIGIGADYAIYFMFRYREEMSKGLDWNEALVAAESHSGKAILFVACSVALGYMCLILSGFLMHIYLGLLVPLAMIVCSVGTLTLIPIMIMALKPRFISRRKPEASRENA